MSEKKEMSVREFFVEIGRLLCFVWALAWAIYIVLSPVLWINLATHCPFFDFWHYDNVFGWTNLPAFLSWLLSLPLAVGLGLAPFLRWF